MEEMPVAKVLQISACGHNECWLRDRIFDDPSVLGLGDLQPVMKEKTQPQGGRLDLLLKNPEDDSMFEVELQLGATDESHIIRTMEYWDCEKRRWPNRSHTAVLVAEAITSRFFNVVQLLSHAVPIIGIEANILQVGTVQGLHFNKIIDSYEEPEETEPGQQLYDENHWIENYPAALECARWYKVALEKVYGSVPVKFFEDYISILVEGVARVWITKRKNDRALIEVKHGEAGFQEAVDHLNSEGVSFDTKKNKYFAFHVNLQQIKEKAAAHEWLVSRLSQHLKMLDS